MEGWIKIHRKLLEWEWYDDCNVFRLFFHLLLTVNYEDKNWHGTTIHAGQIITSVDKLAGSLHLSTQQIRTAINKLKSTGEITSETTNKYTIITICNFAKYQSFEGVEQQTKQQTNNNQTTNEQQTNNNQITTTKEIKNKRNKEDSFDYAQAVAELESGIKESVLQCSYEIQSWIEYKKTEFRKTYKSANTFRAFLKHLFELGNGNPETMKAIIEQSIANRYQGIFELKKSYNNGNFNNPRSADYIPTERIVAAGFAMAKAGM